MTTRSWLRRWRWVLLALVVLVPASALTAMSVNTFDYLGGLPVVRDVPHGATAHYGDASLRLLSRQVITASSAAGRRDGLPEGTELVLAIIRIDPSKVPAKRFDTCDAELVRPTPGGDRTWQAGTTATDYEQPIGLSSACLLARRPAYRYQAVFLVPAGEGASAELRVSSLKRAPQELRLR